MSFFTSSRPFIIAGPCSAESPEQIMAVANELKGTPVQLFRAGVWKPRTRPGSFEGNGETALAWLKDMTAATGLGFAVEVAEVSHIDLALKYGAAALWIGARTTVNPFQVQRLAEALNGIRVPVLVKNPVNPDVDLWLGSIERFERIGIKDVAAIHRGFSGYASVGGYRNQPNWPIPIELKRRRPELAIICDPSHITGKSSRVAAMSQKALDMHFDGLMIETHPDPANALSDAAQQLTPAQLKQLLAGLVVRAEFTDDMSSKVRLEYLRQLMDNIDVEIIDLIAKRIELSKQVGDVKKECNMTAYQPARWREIVAATGKRAKDLGIDEQFILSLYEQIHDNSIKTQIAVLSATENEIKK